MKLYNDLTLKELKSKKNTLLAFNIVVTILALSIIGLLIFISTYETRTLYIVIASIIGVIYVLGIIFTSDYYSCYAHLYREYEGVLNGKDESVQATILEIKEKPITLTDDSVVYPVIYKINEEEKECYLNRLVNASDIPLLKEVTLVISQDYLKEVIE